MVCPRSAGVTEFPPLTKKGSAGEHCSLALWPSAAAGLLG
jgi:hypothetical protein